MQRENQVDTTQAQGHLPAKDRGLWRNCTGRHLELRLPASRTGRTLISVVQAARAVVLRYGSLSRLIHPPPSEVFPDSAPHPALQLFKAHVNVNYLLIHLLMSNSPPLQGKVLESRNFWFSAVFLISKVVPDTY